MLQAVISKGRFAVAARVVYGERDAVREGVAFCAGGPHGNRYNAGMNIAPGIVAAEPVKADSWLHQERFKWFLDGYGYASSQTRAIPTLAAVPPEELYFAVCAIVRGAHRKGHTLPRDLTPRSSRE
jgi:hypothetical protein